MPLLHISLRSGKPAAYRQAIFDGLYRAIRETLNVPDDDQFMTITEHDPANFRTGTGYGVARSEDVVYIQITVFDTRTPEQKKALMKDITDAVVKNLQVQPDRVVVQIVESPKDSKARGGVPFSEM